MMNINNDKKDYQDYEIEDGFCIMKIQNKTPHKKEVFRKADRSFLQLHFCIKMAAKLIFNEERYH